MYCIFQNGIIMSVHVHVRTDEEYWEPEELPVHEMLRRHCCQHIYANHFNQLWGYEKYNIMCKYMQNGMESILYLGTNF